MNVRLSGHIFLSGLAVASLVVLLMLEVALSYDTAVRQYALALTNIAALAALLVLRRHLRRLSATLPWPLVWCVALGVWFDATGNFLHLYARLSWWDKPSHAVGSAAVALACFLLLAALQRLGRVQLPASWQALIAIALATALAAIYEISEYIGDLLFATHRVTDLYDTADDLLWNLLGAALAAAVAFWLRKRPHASAATRS